MRPAMAKSSLIKLDDLDLGQLLDRLESHAEAWRKTAEYLRTEMMHAGEFFPIEECSKPEEADDIAAHYGSIITKIREPMEAQS